MNVLELRRQTREETERLNDSNQNYFASLAEYLRTKKLVKSELELEETIAGMLADLLEAQEKGISAEEYFGRQPSVLADEILENVETLSGRTLLFFLVNLGLLFVTLVMNTWAVKGGGLEVPLANLLLQLVFVALAIWLMMKTMNEGVYKKVSKLKYFAGGVLYLSAILAPILLPKAGVITLSRGVSLLIYGALLLDFIYQFRKESALRYLSWTPIMLAVIGAVQQFIV